MKSAKLVKAFSILTAVTSMGMLFGCSNFEVNTKRGNIPGVLIRYELQEADRAVEAARNAGKDKLCPAEFKDAEDAKNHAYDVFRACHTEEGVALAKQATAKANALCPQPAPSDNIRVNPSSIMKGQSATLTWSSQNATECDIQPYFGPVKLQGSMTITPNDNTLYTLVCSGEGGTAKSSTSISVITPAPVAKLCRPAVIDIEFDTDKSDIKPKYHDELKKLADFLNEYPDVKGFIDGHTDNVASKDYNQKLSQRRAGSVRNYLINNLGIAPERLGARGFGLTKPIADNNTKEGRQQNRRVESNFNCNSN